MDSKTEVEQAQRAKISETLAKANEAMLREIIRQAESFLTAQLQSGLAADQRAMTFAAILAAVIAFLIGGVASIVAAKIDVWPHIFPVVIATCCLLASLSFAISAAKPTNFEYCGNDPKNYVVDLEKNKTLERVLAEQAAFYSRDITRNERVLDDNHNRLRLSLQWALSGIFVSAGLEFMLMLAYSSRHGFGWIWTVLGG